jgi:hypothetical protein
VVGGEGSGAIANFKCIACADISEFESSHPSHGVGLCSAMCCGNGRLSFHYSKLSPAARLTIPTARHTNSGLIKNYDLAFPAFTSSQMEQRKRGAFQRIGAPLSFQQSRSKAVDAMIARHRSGTCTRCRSGLEIGGQALNQGRRRCRPLRIHSATWPLSPYSGPCLSTNAPQALSGQQFSFASVMSGCCSWARHPPHGQGQ